MPIQRYASSFQTTSATPTVVISIPVGAGSSARVDVDFQVINAGFTQAASGTVAALFLRPPVGNIIRATGSGGVLGASITVSTNIAVNVPTIELVPNTTTQSVDIRLTGQSGVTFNWRLTPNVRRD